MLTLKDLKDMKPETIFASGETEIEHPYYGQAPKYPKTTKVKWIAIRGGIWDWAIYHSFHSNLMDDPWNEDDSHLNSSDIQIAHNGQKLFDFEKIKRLVPCDEEALEMYRL